MTDPCSTIVGIVDLLDKAKKAYDKFKDVKNLPKAFGTISGQVDLATSIFKDAKNSAKQSAENDKIRDTVNQCESDAKDLNATTNWSASLRAHQRQVASSLQDIRRQHEEGRKGEVEKIWKRILDSVQLLAGDFGIQN